MLLKKSARYLEGAHQPGKSGQHYNKGGQRGAYTCMEMLSIFISKNMEIKSMFLYSYYK